MAGAAWAERVDAVVSLSRASQTSPPGSSVHRSLGLRNEVMPARLLSDEPDAGNLRVRFCEGKGGAIRPSYSNTPRSETGLGVIPSAARNPLPTRTNSPICRVFLAVFAARNDTFVRNAAYSSGTIRM